MANLAVRSNLNRDLLAELLADKRSPNTRRAYERDLKDFFRTVANSEPTPALVSEFLGLPRADAIALVLSYKAKLIDKELAEATVNRRLAALKSLVNYAQKLEKCAWDLDAVQGEKVQTYRDTSGIGAADYAKLLGQCDKSTPKGLRDYAILRLIWDNALRRGEISAANAGDFEGVRLGILGKGRGSQKEFVGLAAPTAAALQAWLATREAKPADPLFIALTARHQGHRLTGGQIYNIVRGVSEKAGIEKRFSPHRGRHSSITAAAEATGGDLRRVQKLSRHRKVETVLIYVDQARSVQAEVSEALADLV
jgi:integrase/recombinase XerC